MGDSISLRAPKSGNAAANVNVSVTGKELLDEVISGIDLIENKKINIDIVLNTNSDDIQARQAEALKQMKDAYQKYASDVSNIDMSASLANAVNAYSAITGDSFSDIKENFADMAKVIDIAFEKIRSSGKDIFSKSDYIKAFSAVDMLRERMSSPENFISKLSSQEFDDYINRYKQQVLEIEKLHARNVELQNQVTEAQSMSGKTEMQSQINNLTADLEEAQGKLQGFSDTFRQELQSFLESQNLDPGDYRFTEYFQDIEDGSITASQAIRKISTEYSNMISNISANMLTNFTTQLDELIEKINKVDINVSKILDGNFSMPKGGFVAQSGMEDLAGNVQSSIEGLREVKEVITDTLDAWQQIHANDSAAGLQILISLISKLSASLSELSNSNSPNTLLSIFRSFVEIGTGNINSGSFTKITEFAESISKIPNTDKITSLSGLTFSGYRDLKISKTLVTNLAGFLNSIKDINSGNIDKLSNINFENFNNIKLPKGIGDRLLDVAAGIKEIDASLSGGGITGVSTVINNLLSGANESTAGVESSAAAISAEVDAIAHATDAKNDLARAEAGVSSAAGDTSGVENSTAAISAEADAAIRATAAKNDLAGAEAGVSSAAGNTSGIEDRTVAIYNEGSAAEDATERLRDFEREEERAAQLIKESVTYTNGRETSRSQTAYNPSTNQTATQTLHTRYDKDGNETFTLVQTASAGFSTIEDNALKAASAIQQVESKITSISKAKISFKGFGDKESEEYNKINAELDKLVGRLNSLKKNGINNNMSPADVKNFRTELSQISAEYLRLINRINKYKDARKSAVVPKVKGTVKSTEKTPELLSATKAEKKYNDLAIAVRKYKKELKDAEELGISTKSDQYSNLSDAVNRLENLMDRLNNVKLGKTEENRKAFTEEFDAATAAAKNYSQALSDLESLNAKEQNTEERKNDALNKGSALMSKMKNALTDYTLAKTGESRESYSGIEKLVKELSILDEKLKSGDITVPKYLNDISKIGTSFSTYVTNIKGAHEATRSFTDRFGALASQFSYWFSTTRLVMSTINSIKKMIATVRELDDEMTQLMIVSNQPKSTIVDYANKVVQDAKKTGMSAKDIINSATTYARLGYSLEDSDILARYSDMIAKVGNIDTQNIQDAMTAITKAFSSEIDSGDFEGSIERVMDKLVTVGNNFPISVSQIADGLNNAGSALAAAGSSFEESVALLVAANATTQDISKASTGLRTIVARIRRTKTELDDLGETMTDAKYDELIKALTSVDDGAGISLTNAAGDFRTPLEILKDIAKVWDDLSNKKQAAIIEALGGTRQQTILTSIFTQFKEADKAMRAMEESAGAIDSAFEKWADSVSGHINKFKAAFTNVAINTFTSDFISGFVDLGTVLLNVINLFANLASKIGGLPTVIYAAASAIAVMNAQLIVNKYETVISFIGSIRNILSNFSLSAFGILITYLTQATNGINLLSLAANNAKVAVGGVVAVVGAAMIAYNAYKKKQQEKQDKLTAGERSSKEARDLYELYSAYNAAQNSIDGTTRSSNSLKTATDALRSALGDEAKSVDNLSNSYEDLVSAQLRMKQFDIKQALDIAEENLFNAGSANMFTSMDDAKAIAFINNRLGYIGMPNVKWNAEMVDALKAEYDNMLAEINGWTQSTDTKEYKDLILSVKYLERVLLPYLDRLKSFNDISSDLQSIEDGTAGIDSDASGIASSFSSAAKSVSSLRDNLKSAEKALKLFTAESEKGDVAKSYDEAYTKFAEDWNAGRIGSNAVQTAINLFIPDDVQASLNYDVVKLGEMLNDEMFSTIFGEGADSSKNYAGRFIDYLRSQINEGIISEDLVNITENTDGTLSMQISSFSELAAAIGSTENALSSLFGYIGMYSNSVGLASKDIDNLAESIGLTGDIATNSKDVLRDVMEVLALKGYNNNEIYQIINDFVARGFIDKSTISENIAKEISEATEEANKYIQQRSDSGEITIDFDSEQVKTEARTLIDGINDAVENELNDKVIWFAAHPYIKNADEVYDMTYGYNTTSGQVSDTFSNIDTKLPFDDDVKAHEDALKLRKISDQEYFEWYNDAFRNAYKEGTDKFLEAQQTALGLSKTALETTLNEKQSGIDVMLRSGGQTQNILSMYKSMEDDIRETIEYATNNGATVEEIGDLYSKLYGIQDKISDQFSSDIGHELFNVDQLIKSGSFDEAAAIVTSAIRSIEDEIQSAKDANRSEDFIESLLGLKDNAVDKLHNTFTSVIDSIKNEINSLNHTPGASTDAIIANWTNAYRMIQANLNAELSKAVTDQDAGWIQSLYSMLDEADSAISDVFSDRLSDKKFEIEWMQQEGKSADEIKAKWIEVYDDVSEEISRLEALGKDETDDTIQSLMQEQWAAQEAIHSLFTDTLDNRKFEIEMLQRQKDSAGQIKDIYTGLLEDISKELADAYHHGLDDNNDFVQSLLSEWWEIYDTVVETFGEISDDVTSLTGELAAAAKRLEELRSGGEKGDLAVDYAEVYKQFNEDWEAGKTGTNAVQTAIELFIPQDVLSSLGYDMKAAGELLHNSLVSELFAPDSGGEYSPEAFAGNLLSVLGKGGFEDVASVVIDKTTDSFKFQYTSLDKLASAFGITNDAMTVLLDAFDAFGIEVMMGTEDVANLATELGLAEDRAISAKDDIQGVMDALASRGKSTFEINKILRSLVEAGRIDLGEFSDEQIGEMIKGAVDSATNMLDQQVQDAEQQIVSSEQDAEQHIRAAGQDAGADAGKSAEETKQDLSDISSILDTLNDVNIHINSNADEASSKLDKVYKKLRELDGASATISVGVNDGTGGSSTGGASSFGVNKVRRANADGTDDFEGGKTLVNELGPELISANGKAFVANGGAPAVVDLPKGSIVLDAEDTKNAMSVSKGGTGTKRIGRAFAKGTGVESLVNGAKKAWNGIVSWVTSATGNLSNLKNYNTGSGGGSDEEPIDPDWFKKAYDEHKHLLNIDKEDMADYLRWLQDAYQKAYEQEIITLEDRRKYCEEVYKGLQSLFDDYMADWEFAVEMLGHQDDTADQIENIYKQLIIDVRTQLEDAYNRGLDDNDDYVQSLWKKWWDYYDKIKQAREDAEKGSKDSIDKLVQYRIKMIEKERQKEKEAYSDRLSDLKKFIDDRKKELSDDAKDEDYLKDQAEKRKRVSDLETQLSQLEFDNSAWAQKKRLELEEELTTAREELRKFERDHAIDAAGEELDAIYEMAEKATNDRTKLIDDELDNAQILYEQAMDDIRNNSQALFDDMIAYELQYGAGTADAVTEMWEEAYKAMLDYATLFGSLYGDVNLGNFTNYSRDIVDTALAVGALSMYKPPFALADTSNHGPTVEEDKSSANNGGGGGGSSSNVYTSSDGTRYQISADALADALKTDLLHANTAMANNARNIAFDRVLGDVTGTMQYVNSLQRTPSVINMGDIVINGNADTATVSEIRRTQREQLTNMLGEFRRLSN